MIGAFDQIFKAFSSRRQAAADETAQVRLAVAVDLGADRELARAVRARFDSVKTFKPNSSRAESKEIFELGLGFKSAPVGGENRSEA